MEGTNHHFANIRDAKTFALAGNAILTLESLKTSAYYTFKIRQSKDNENLFFVNLLAGPNNNYVYLGLIREGRFMWTKNSKVGADALSFKAFNYFWNFDHGENGLRSLWTQADRAIKHS
jgi:hypothetical protein